ncbi:hypothetical protein TWF730_006183 [Orbilia blumenaviensis]|uniref:Uncharacterized protein n=1 Tax=Orbilia blumenaviensis TaxID=1796055 RepID=A0AAV9TVR7_9PEZI
MAVFHQSTAKKHWRDCLHSYHDWTAAHDGLSFSVLSMDAVFTTIYFAVSIFMTVYYLAMVDYLQENAIGTEGLSKVIGLLKARAAITIVMAYICLCGFYWLIKRLGTVGSPQLIAAEIDSKYEIYPRMYSVVILVIILRITTFLLAYPKWYPQEVMKIRIPPDEFVAKPLIKERENKELDFIVGDIIAYFWGWSFLFLTTAAVSISGLLMSADFVGFIIHPWGVRRRTSYQIFDLVFFTATQPFWTTLDVLLILCEVFECCILCIFELLCCRKPQPMNYDEYSERYAIGKIRSPRYYNEPKLSVSYYWAGRAWFKCVRMANYLWHVVRTSVIGMWFGARWWGMKVRWGIKLRSRASGVTVILGPHHATTANDANREFFHGVVAGALGSSSSRGDQNDQFETIELGEMPPRQPDPGI